MIGQGIMTLVFLALGILFAFGKGAFLIAGYNVMSKEEKARYDEKKMLKYMSAMMFTCAACMAVGWIGTFVEKQWLVTLGFCLLIPCVVCFLIRMNKASRK